MRFFNAHFPWLFMLLLITLQSALSAPVISLNLGFADKIIHFTTFGIAGWFATRGLVLSTSGPVRKSMLLIVIFGGAVFAGIDEWHQSFVPGRSPDLLDWLADMSGILFFTFIYTKRFPAFFRA